MSNAQNLWFKQQLTCIPWSLHSLSLFFFFSWKQSHAERVSVEKLLSYKILWWPTNAFNLSAWNKPPYRNLSFGCEVVNHESRWMEKVKSYCTIKPFSVFFHYAQTSRSRAIFIDLLNLPSLPSSSMYANLKYEIFSTWKLLSGKCTSLLNMRISLNAFSVDGNFNF